MKPGGWPQLEYLGTLKPGEKNSIVATLRERMLISGDLPDSPTAEPAPAEPDLYDGTLAAAVQNYQRRHGLKTDGIVGRKTREDMNHGSPACQAN